MTVMSYFMDRVSASLTSNGMANVYGDKNELIGDIFNEKLSAEIYMPSNKFISCDGSRFSFLPSFGKAELN